jgi:hypothetical protein
MLCFGLGTLPMLLTMGVASEKLTYTLETHRSFVASPVVSLLYLP